MEVSGQFHAPAALLQYPPNSRLAGLGEKMSLGHTGIRATTLQSRSPSVVTILTELSRRTSSFTTERSSLEADSSSSVKEFATILRQHATLSLSKDPATWSQPTPSPSSFLNPLAPDFFFILAHPVYKMWIIQEPNKLALWKKLHFEERKKRRV